MKHLQHATTSLRLILRSHAQRGVSKDEAAPWFETHRFAMLLTMRPIEAATTELA